ncbi:transmembrane protein, putative [Bodo saltans]|uniref:Transmembrane protein, putative n=1 Tax=Bodo saltans TaxID=75058 RepID=A0A0S4KIA6_BODSA|nr:transmembrane protein, putative [Bodo saltans]|eukprot:CUI13262.1 transmembrane protein, putative [Bodo saltans]
MEGFANSLTHTFPTATFVLKYMEPVFGAYVERREWYFVVEWSLAAVGGVVKGVVEAVAEDGDACSAAEWGTWCMIVIGSMQLAGTIALMPFSVRFEMACSIFVGALTLLSNVLSSSIGTLDAAEVIVNAAGILELIVMSIMLVNVATLRCVAPIGRGCCCCCGDE